MDGAALTVRSPADQGMVARRGGATPGEERLPMLTEGTMAPAFTVVDHDGTETSLEQFRGSWVLLWWYPKADTPG